MADTRFSPIQSSELSELACSVSLLHDFEEAPDWKAWSIGQHGVRALWKSRRGSHRSATFLPEVAQEQGWNHLETMKALVAKAGDSFTPSMLSTVQVTRYQSSKITVTYEDYRARIE